MPVTRKKTVPVDGASEALTQVDYAHHELHDGRAYVVYAAATIAISNTLVISVQTADSTRELHMVEQARSSGEANLVIREGATTTGGTLFTPVNRHRSSTNTPTTTAVRVDPTVSVPGSVIYESHFGAGNNRGGESRGTVEMVLKPNTTYTYTITSEASGNDCNLQLDWYEHVDRR